MASRISDGRGIQPKSQKIRNTQHRSFYRSQHPFCEICILETGYYNTTGTELHHIIPGDGRTDELWNMISVSRKHHNDCTTHIQGSKADLPNIICFAVKLLKGEISTDRLEKLGKLKEVWQAAGQLQGAFDKYVKRGNLG